ncbi:MAG: hypothetical protein LBD18_02735 [Treponema sp.]|jgi:hypothetical protein|nr:hypothetical protein [Treponema sp.]
MKRYALIALLIAAFTPGAETVSAMDWPSRDAVIVRNFGYNDQGRPVLGTVFEGAGPALAAEGGELIFSYSREDSASRLPSPLGAWAAVDHGDGLVSIYGRCEDQGRGSRPLHVEQGGAITGSGISGWSLRQGFYFVLYDKRERRWVNPSMIIAPFPDSRPPQILGVQLRNAEGKPVESGQLRNLKQGRYTIAVNAVDPMSAPGEGYLAPHRIVCSVNGAETGFLLFETISARDGVLMINRNGLVPVKQVYAPFPAFEAGEVYLSRGQALLEIVVQDMAGNSQSALTRMIVE